MIEIKDVIHLYLGCECMYEKEIGIMCEIDTHGIRIDGVYGGGHIGFGLFKPILRNIGDMTEEEKEKFIEVCGIEPEDIDCLIKSPDTFFPGNEMSYGTAHLTNIAQWAMGVKYLLSLHFDLFQLHEQGLCLYKSDLKP